MVSLLFLLIILFLVVLLVARQGGAFLQHKRQLWILGGYLLIQFFALVLMQVLPEINYMDTVSEEEFARQENAGFDLIPMALMGKPEQLDGVFVKEQWEFLYGGNLLSVVFPQNVHINMIVERKETADGRIEVTCYATKTIVELIDFSGEVKTPGVSLENSVLSITMPGYQQLTVSAFSKEFVVNQVSGKPEPIFERLDDPFARTTMGSQLLYLRIPANLEIKSSVPIGFVDTDNPDSQDLKYREERWW